MLLPPSSPWLACRFPLDLDVTRTTGTDKTRQTPIFNENASYGIDSVIFLEGSCTRSSLERGCTRSSPKGGCTRRDNCYSIKRSRCSIKDPHHSITGPRCSIKGGRYSRRACTHRPTPRALRCRSEPPLHTAQRHRALCSPPVTDLSLSL